ncbi:MAG: dual CXXC motif small (seleno)protein [Desulfatibacillaceae bacterium]
MLRCRSCGKTYTLEEFGDDIDERIEEMLANVRCDKL